MNIQEKFFPFAKIIPGEVGIELEVEGQNIPHVLTDTWRTEADGSLKAAENCEYVLVAPVPRNKVDKVFNDLVAAWNKNQTVIHESHRAGTHIHINVRDFELYEVISFAIAYYIVEDILVNYCGEDRVGNHFCLRSRDAQWVLEKVEDALVRGRIKDLLNDNIRYSSLNFKALIQYGSLEFRSMRSTRKLLAIKKWIKLLLALKDYARGKNPKDVLFEFSIKGPEKFYSDIFGENAIIKYDPSYEDIMRSGVNRVQSIAYCKIWENEKEEPVPMKDEVIMVKGLKFKAKRIPKPKDPKPVKVPKLPPGVIKVEKDDEWVEKAIAEFRRNEFARKAKEAPNIILDDFIL